MIRTKGVKLASVTLGDGSIFDGESLPPKNEELCIQRYLIDVAPTRVSASLRFERLFTAVAFGKGVALG